MNTPQFYTALLVILIFLFGVFIGYSLSNCDEDIKNVEYWKIKYLEEQRKNEILTNQILDVLVNSYMQKIVWSVSGLNSYKIILCSINYQNDFEVPFELKSIFNNLCIKKS